MFAQVLLKKIFLPYPFHQTLLNKQLLCPIALYLSDFMIRFYLSDITIIMGGLAHMMFGGKLVF